MMNESADDTDSEEASDEAASDEAGGQQCESPDHGNHENSISEDDSEENNGNPAPEDDYPENPDEWNPPDGWEETPTGDITGGTAGYAECDIEGTSIGADVNFGPGSIYGGVGSDGGALGGVSVGVGASANFTTTHAFTVEDYVDWALGK